MELPSTIPASHKQRVTGSISRTPRPALTRTELTVLRLRISRHMRLVTLWDWESVVSVLIQYSQSCSPDLFLQLRSHRTRSPQRRVTIQPSTHITLLRLHLL